MVKPYFLIFSVWIITLATGCATPEAFLFGSKPEPVYPTYTHPQDVFLGMGMRDVQGVWGSPDRIQIAGDPQYRNQRWVYTEATPVGHAQRVVYFEDGEVVGWERVDQ